MATTHRDKYGIFLHPALPNPGAVTLIEDDLTGPVRAGLLEALDWWNGETLSRWAER